MVLNLIKGQKSESRGIVLSMSLIMIAIVATLMYINFSMDTYLREIDNKYGNLSVVFYSLDGAQIDEFDFRIESEASNLRRTEIVKVEGVNTQLIIIDEKGYNDVAPLRDSNGNILPIGDGVLISSNLKEIVGDKNILEIELLNKKIQLEKKGDFDEADFFFIGDKTLPVVIISKAQFESVTGESLPMNNLFLKSAYSQKEIRDLDYDDNKYGMQNVLEEKDLMVKQSSYSFLYAVSFTLVGLITVVLGGVYNFCRLFVNRNLEEIGFFRSIGTSFQGAMSIIYKMIFTISCISYVLGLVIGVILGNIAIGMEYGFSGLRLPSLMNLGIGGIVVLLLPIVFLYLESNKHKKKNPVELLISNQDESYDVSDDKCMPYLVKAMICIAIYIVALYFDSKLQGTIKMVVSILRIYLVLKSLELIIVLLFELTSKIPIDKQNNPVNYLAIKNLFRSKKKKSSVYGLFILILSIYIAMFSVFMTFREDAVNKVENQFNGDIFITEFQGEEALLDEKIQALRDDENIEYVEIGKKEYMDIESNQIMTYFISPEDFERSFNYFDSDSQEKIKLKQGEVVIGSTLARAGDIKPGETVTLNDGNKNYDYKVQAVCDSNEYMGYVAYIPVTEEIEDPNTLTLILIDGLDPEIYKETLEESFSKDLAVAPRISTKKDVMNNFRANAIKGTEFLEIMLFFVSTIGVLILLNQLFQYIDMQRKEYSILRSMGLTLEEVKKKIYIEMIIMIGQCSIFVLIGGFLMTKVFVDIATFTSRVGDVWSYYYDLIGAVKIIAYSLVIIALGLYLKVNRNFSANIVDDLKYERG